MNVWAVVGGWIQLRVHRCKGGRRWSSCRLHVHAVTVLCWCAHVALPGPLSPRMATAVTPMMWARLSWLSGKAVTAAQLVRVTAKVPASVMASMSERWRGEATL